MLKKLLDKTFWKFICVGIINTLVGTTVMFVFYNIFHLNYWISSASNYIVGSVVSYLLNKHFTFQNKSNDKKTVMKFVINITACYLIAYGMARPLIGLALQQCTEGMRDNISMLVGMGLFVMLNYLGQRFLVFCNRE